MHHSDEQEVELVETHTLACESCVTRLEALEIQIAATKLALQELHNEQVAKAYQQEQKASWRKWATLPRLSLAGAALALALTVGIAVPGLHNRSYEQVSLSDYRGQDTAAVTKDHPLDVVMNAEGISQSDLQVQLVSETGNAIWQGSAAVRDGKLEVKVPALTASGAYFFRLYLPGSTSELREFAFNVR